MAPGHLHQCLPYLLSPTCFSFGFSLMLGGSTRNVSALRARSKEKCASTSKGVTLRMVIVSQLLGQSSALYLSAKGEKAAEETVAFIPHQGKRHVLAAGGCTARPCSNKQAKKKDHFQGHTGCYVCPSLRYFDVHPCTWCLQPRHVMMHRPLKEHFTN